MISDTVAGERLQLQAELDRRMTLFEQNHSACVAELESSRRALIDQLAASENTTAQLRDELAVVQQKLRSKVCSFIPVISPTEILLLVWVSLSPKPNCPRLRQ